MLHQPLLGRHLPGAIPLEQRQAICLRDHKREDRPANGTLLSSFFTIAPKLSWPLCEPMCSIATMIPHPVRRGDHGQFDRAITSSQIRAACLDAHRRIVTGSVINSTDAGATRALICGVASTGTTSSASTTSGQTSSPFCASVRQIGKWFAFNEWWRATSLS